MNVRMIVAPDVRVETLAGHGSRVTCDYGELELLGVDACVLEAFLDDLECGPDAEAARMRLCETLGHGPGRQVFGALVPLVLADAPADPQGPPRDGDSSVAWNLLAGWDAAATTILDRRTSPDDSASTTTLELMRLLSRQGSGAMPHVVDGFKEHLSGVWQILVRWGQPPAVATAGLLHSIYATDSYQASLLSLRQRHQARALAGEVAEGLAFLFCTLDRARLWADVDRGHRGPDGYRATNFRTGQRCSLGDRTLAALAVIELANLLEQACDSDGAPAAGVARLTRVVATLAPDLDVVPPICAWLQRPLAHADEVAAVDHYRRGRAQGALAGGHDALVAAARANPHVGEPLIVLAEWGHTSSPTAKRMASYGLARLRAWGDAWDKRCPYVQWQQRALRILAARDADGAGET